MLERHRDEDRLLRLPITYDNAINEPRTMCRRPVGKRNLWVGICALSGADMCPACCAAFSYAAGPYGVRRSGPNQRRVLLRHFGAHWFS